MAQVSAAADATGGEARVVESADLLPRVLVFLGVCDAFAPAVCKGWRATAATLKPRITLGTFNSISASLRADFLDSDEEDEMDRVRQDSGGHHVPACGAPACSIDGYYLEAREGVELQEEELKDVLVGHLPAVIVFQRGYMFGVDEWGSKGEWTVGGIFAAIAANEEYARQGPSDHNFFEGLELDPSRSAPSSFYKYVHKGQRTFPGRYDVFWGS